jgi:hypothetical protein
MLLVDMASLVDMALLVDMATLPHRAKHNEKVWNRRHKR